MDRDIKAVLLDIDGTIVPLDIGLNSTIKAIRQLGLKSPSKNYLIQETFGYTSDEYFKMLFPGKEHLLKKFKDLKYKAYLEKGVVKPFPDTLKVVKKLRERGYKIGLVSTNQRKFAKHVVKETKIQVDVLISLEDAKHRKPHPEPVLKACEKLSVKPNEAIFVGDDTFDIEAGKKAGTITVGITTGKKKEKDFIAVRADYIIKNLTELLTII